jgi:hypothetical protein
VYDLLAWIEGSTLGRMMRESGPWTYALVNLTHVLGIASLFGAVLVIDLRLLGLSRGLPLRPLADAAIPIARAGFILAIISGAGLLSANATEYSGNPFLLIKFPAIAIALVNALLLERSAAWKAGREGTSTDAQRRQLATMGALSLASWLTAIAAGRMIGYW